MSDVFEGPGYWMASDGKWYPPSRHPDENYRNRFLSPPEQPPVPTSDTAAVTEFPAVEIEEALQQPEVAASTSSAFNELVMSRSAQMDETIEISGEQLHEELAEVEAQRREALAQQAAIDAHQADLTSAADEVDAAASTDEAETEAASTSEAADGVTHVDDHVRVGEAEQVQIDAEPVSVESPPQSEPETFSVAATPFSAAPERPVFEDNPPPSVIGAAPTSQVGRTRVELASATADTTNNGRPTAGFAEQPASTDLVRVSTIAQRPATMRDRLVASVMFLSGVAMIVGSFVDWTTSPSVQTGWERGDGIVTVLAGVIGSAMAGPIFVGFKHPAPRMVALTVGVIGLIVTGLVAFSDVGGDSGAALGLGLWVVLFASVAMSVAALVDRGDYLYLD